MSTELNFCGFSEFNGSMSKDIFDKRYRNHLFMSSHTKVLVPLFLKL